MRPANANTVAVQWAFWTLRARRQTCYGCTEGKANQTYETLNVYEGDPCKDCAGRGYHFIPWQRRVMFNLAFFRWGDREWYLPSVVTLWHKDPELRGDDDSCRRPYAKREREAYADRRRVAQWFWRKCSHHYGWWHVRHYHWQVGPAQNARRWAFTRCATCGERFRFGEAPVSSSWDSIPREHWWSGESGMRHMDCAAEAAVAVAG